MVEVDRFDLEEIAFALSDQNVYDEHVHLVDPATGEIVLWTQGGGVDGKTPVDWLLDDSLIMLDGRAFFVAGYTSGGALYGVIVDEPMAEDLPVDHDLWCESPF